MIAKLISKNKFLKNKLLTLSVEHLKRNPGDVEYLILQVRDDAKKVFDKYPLILNPPNPHIEKVINLVKYFSLPEENCIVDVGASNGVVAKRFAQAFPGTLIYSFEPVLNTFKQLQKSVSSFSNIQIVNKGLGCITERMNIHIADRASSSSFLEIKKNISNEYLSKNIRLNTIQQAEISTLDTEIPKDKKVNILKLDVQGFELKVLKGGNELLKRTNIVVLEMQNHDLYLDAPKYYELDDFLRIQGFELFDIIPSLRQDMKLYEWDGIYISKNIGM